MIGLVYFLVSSLAPLGRTMAREGSAPFAARAGPVAGTVEVFVTADPDPCVVPVSLQVSMVAEGFHGNRGLVP